MAWLANSGDSGGSPTTAAAGNASGGFGGQDRGGGGQPGFQRFQRAGPSYVATAGGGSVPPWQRGMAGSFQQRGEGGGRGGFGGRDRGGGPGGQGRGPPGGGQGGQEGDEGWVEGKKQRKAIQRRTIDYYSGMLRWKENRYLLRGDERDRPELVSAEPDPQFVIEMMPSFVYRSTPIVDITAKFIHTSVNKNRCPINSCRWFPDGRRLITGTHSGEFTLWNGFTFNFETIQQAHDVAIRAMTWSPSDQFLVSADDRGTVKYWQQSLTNVKVLQAHKEAVRGIAFAPSDAKFATGADDGLVKVWDFARAHEEKVLQGHGWDVKCVDWHPSKGLVASGGKDNLVKLWDPKSGKALATLHGHKNTVLALSFNLNGNWVLTACRDSVLRLYDIRTLRDFQNLRGHKKEVTCAKWHPFHERHLVSGGSDGFLGFWEVGTEGPIAQVEQAHESQIWEADYHPMGHVLATASNDVTTRFWGRNRPGDGMDEAFLVGSEKGKRVKMGVVENDWDEEGDTKVPGLPGLAGGLPGLDARGPALLPGLGGPAPSNPLPFQQSYPSSSSMNSFSDTKDRDRDNRDNRDRDRDRRRSPPRGRRGGRNFDSDEERDRSPPRRGNDRDRDRGRGDRDRNRNRNNQDFDRGNNNNNAWGGASPPSLQTTPMGWNTPPSTSSAGQSGWPPQQQQGQGQGYPQASPWGQQPQQQQQQQQWGQQPASGGASGLTPQQIQAMINQQQMQQANPWGGR